MIEKLSRAALLLFALYLMFQLTRVNPEDCIGVTIY